MIAEADDEGIDSPEVRSLRGYLSPGRRHSDVSSVPLISFTLARSGVSTSNFPTLLQFSHPSDLQIITLSGFLVDYWNALIQTEVQPRGVRVILSQPHGV